MATINQQLHESATHGNRVNPDCPVCAHEPRRRAMDVPHTDYFEIGLNLAANLPENTSATAEPNVRRILRGMASYLSNAENLYNGRVPLTQAQIFAMLTDALDNAK